MKIRLDKKQIQWGITAFLVIAAGVCFYFLADHLGGIFRAVRTFIGILSPIIYGACIAYILNPLMKFLEKTIILKGICSRFHLTPSEKAKKFIRLFSVIFSLVFMFACIYGLITLMVPQLLNSIVSLAYALPRYITTVRQYIVKLFEHNTNLESSAISTIESLNQSLQNWLNNTFLPNLNETVSSFSSQLMDLISVAKNFLIGSIISIYFLNGKEMFIARGKRFLYAALGNTELANDVLRDLRYINKTFGGFLLGKIIDSAIIGIICYVIISIINMPYPLLVSVVIGVTNIIPFFGPFIGAIPCALLILLVSPVKCLYFIIFILILQQVDGNLIGPKILSSSTGLSSFMVVVAILVGGGMFGFVGLIIGVPLFAVLMQFGSHFINDRLKKYNLPQEAEEYQNMDHIDPSTNKPERKEQEASEENLFKYGIKGRKMEDPNTDDEILPVYKIKKSRIHLINLPIEKIREPKFEEVSAAENEVKEETQISSAEAEDKD